jgi:hypothetical protein
MSPVLLMLSISGTRSMHHSRHALARAINMRMTLASTIKGTLMVSEYYSKMKKLVDEMESADKKLDPEKFMSYVLAWCLRLLCVLNLSCPTSCFFRC